MAGLQRKLLLPVGSLCFVIIWATSMLTLRQCSKAEARGKGRGLARSGGFHLVSPAKPLELTCPWVTQCIQFQLVPSCHNVFVSLWLSDLCPGSCHLSSAAFLVLAEQQQPGGRREPKGAARRCKQKIVEKRLWKSVLRDLQEKLITMHCISDAQAARESGRPHPWHWKTCCFGTGFLPSSFSGVCPSASFDQTKQALC